MWLHRSTLWSFLLALPLIIGSAESGYNDKAGATGVSGSRPSNFECASEGYHADPNNCQLYYRCVGWGQGSVLTKFKFECGPGTVFSKQRGDVCTHPFESGRPECGGSDEKTNDLDSNNVYEPNPQPEYVRPTYETPIRPMHEPSIRPMHESPVSPMYIPPSSYPTQSTYAPGPSGPAYIPSSGAPQRPATASSYYPPHPSSTSGTTRPPQPNHTGQTSGTTRTPDQPAALFQCQASGFFPDPKDCRKFYRCVDQGTGSLAKYEFSCGEGTVWDPKIGACNHEFAANRADCSSSTETLTQQPEDEAQREPNVPLAQIPHNQSEGPAEEIPIAPSSMGEPGGVQTSGSQAVPCTPLPDGTTAGELAGGQGGQLDSTTASSGGGPMQPSQPPSPPLTSQEPCSSEGFFGDSEDCSKFYRCVGSGSSLTKYEFKCGEGTVWDDRIASCNHRFAVPKCAGVDQGHEGGSQGNEETSNEVDRVEQRPDETNNEVGGEGPDKDNQQPDETNNEVGGEGHNQRPDETANEVGSQPPSPPAPVTTSTQSSYPITASTQPPRDSEVTTSSDQTPNPTQPPESGSAGNSDNRPSGLSPSGECTSEGYFADPENCGNFYRCVESGSTFTKYQFRCGDGTAWDERISSCNHLSAVPGCENADMGPGGGSQQTGETGNEVGSEQGNGDAQKEPEDGGSQSQQGPEGPEAPPPEATTSSSQPITPPTAPTEATNPPESSTDSTASTANPEATGESSSRVTPGIEATSQNPQSTGPNDKIECTKEGFMADPRDCKKFYRCVASEGSGQLTKYEFACGEGTGWDDSIQSCNHVYAVPACGGTAGPTLGETPSSTSSSGEASTTLSQGQTMSTTTTSMETSTISSATSSPTQDTTEATATEAGREPSTEPSPPTESSQTPEQPIETATPPSRGEPQTSSPTESSSQSTEAARPSSQPEDGSTPESGNEPITESSSEASEATSGSSGQTPAPTTTPTSEIPEGSGRPSGPSGDCEGEGFFPHKSDCRKFIRCVPQGNGGYTKYEFDCGPGTAWDDNIQTCNHINLVASCKDDSSNEITNEKGEPGSTSSPLTSEMPEEVIRPSTEKPGEVTESGGSGSESPSESPENSQSTENPAEVTRQDVITAPSSSESSGDSSTTESSESATESSSSSESATESSTSSESATESSTSSESSAESSSTTESSSESSSPSSTSTQSPDPCKPNPKPGEIVCNEPGFNAHPTDCAKFYRCVDNGNGFNVYHFDCPTGTIFDPSISVCNYPESVYPARDCKTGQPPPSSTTEAPSRGSTESTTSSSTESTSVEATTTGDKEETTTSSEASSETPEATEPAGSEQPIEPTTESSSESTESSSEPTTAEGAEGSSEPTTSEGTESSGEPTTTESESTTAEGTESSSEQTTDQSTESSTAEATESSGEPTEAGSTESSGEPVTEEATESSTSSEATESSTSSEATESSTESATTEGSESSSEPSAELTTETSTESSSTESTESTNQPLPPGATPCPIGNLTGEQIVLACPTGFRRHPKYCNLFYQCLMENDMEVKILSFSCPEDTIFDEEKIQCLPESESSKPCAGVKAGARFYRRVEESSASLMKVEQRETLCPGVGHHPYREGCSSVFYKCKKDSRDNLQGYLYKCPRDFVYWSVSRRCERASRLPMCQSRKTSSHKNQNQSSNKVAEGGHVPEEDYNLSARMLRYPF